MKYILILVMTFMIFISFRKIAYTDQENIKEDTVVPCLWFEEGIDELGTQIDRKIMIERYCGTLS